MRRWLGLLVLVGCGRSAAPDPCLQLGDSAQRLVAAWGTAHHTSVSTVDLTASLAAKCRSDQWSLATVRCLANPPCTDPVAAAFVDSILATHVPAADAVAAGAQHPDYPTASTAGTANVFLLEEPDRGPAAPTSYRAPSRASLQWTKAGYCELTQLGPTCSDTVSGNNAWNIGRSKTATVVEHVFGTHVLETTVFETTPQGTPVQTIALDARGQLLSAALFHDGKYAVRLRNGGNGLDGCGAMAYEVDVRQRVVALRCEQWTGGLMLDTHGVAIYRYKRGLAGFVAAETRFGVDNAPLAGNDGVQRVDIERDARGRMAIHRFFDAAGARATTTDDCAGRRKEYDADGSPYRSTCLDAADQPIAQAGGIVTKELLVDGRGCIIGTRFLDANHAPKADVDGVHGEDIQTDAACGNTRETCVDLRGEPHACGPGRPAQVRSKLDERGQAVAVTHWNAQGGPAVDPEFDAFEIRSTYDAVGNALSTSCYDQAARAIDCDGTGFHEKRRTFDAAGRQKDEMFFGVRGERAVNLGASSRRYRYDNYDHAYESQSFDVAGALIEQAGAATVRQLYDLRHQRFAVVLLDVLGKPAHYEACFTGATCPDKPWHAVRIVRLGDGTPDYNQFFDADGQLIEAISCRTDKCFD